MSNQRFYLIVLGLGSYLLLTPLLATPPPPSPTIFDLNNWDKDIILGKKNPKNLRLVAKKYRYNPKKKDYLLGEAYHSFQKMAASALHDGIELKIISAHRSFGRQKAIWEYKWSGRTLVNGKNLANLLPIRLRILKILEYSAMPGSSRHHWGTEIDLNSLNNDFFTKDIGGRKIYRWLKRNAPKFGFCQPYDGEKKRSGYKQERWHWSYLPISGLLTRWAQESLTYADFTEFSGADHSKDLQIINRYIGGISKNCRK